MPNSATVLATIPQYRCTSARPNRCAHYAKLYLSQAQQKSTQCNALVVVLENACFLSPFFVRSHLLCHSVTYGNFVCLVVVLEKTGFLSTFFIKSPMFCHVLASGNFTCLVVVLGKASFLSRPDQHITTNMSHFTTIASWDIGLLGRGAPARFLYWAGACYQQSGAVRPRPYSDCTISSFASNKFTACAQTRTQRPCV